MERDRYPRFITNPVTSDQLWHEAQTLRVAAKIALAHDEIEDALALALGAQRWWSSEKSPFLDRIKKRFREENPTASYPEPIL